MSDDVHEEMKDRLMLLERQVSGLSKRLAEVERELDTVAVEHIYEETDVGPAIREQITRCADCESMERGYGTMWCTAPMGEFGYVEVRPDGFCSEGFPRGGASAI